MKDFTPELKFTIQCGVCRAIKAHVALGDRIKYCSYFYEASNDSLQDIADDYPFNIVALRNHVRKHQTGKKIRLSDIEKAAAKRRHAKEVQVQAEIEARSTGVDLVKESQSEKVWEAILDIGEDRIRAGEMKVTTEHILRAAKDKADYDSKKNNYDLEVAKTMYAFASGERTKADGDTNTKGSADSDNRVEDGPGGVHDETTGDEAPRWPSALSAGNSASQDTD